MKHDHMQECIELCWASRHECQKTLFTHCLEKGGEHLEAEHVKLMADCIQICQTAADFMVRRSPMHVAVCEACADICEACADSCEAVGGAEMLHCAETCRESAAACRAMSHGAAGAGPDVKMAVPVTPVM
jgi:hypothetical protein